MNDTPAPIVIGNLEIGENAVVDGKYLPLTAAELAVLRALASTPSRLVTRDRLIDAVYGPAELVDAPESNTLQVFIGRLRRKLSHAKAQVEVRTYRARGYVIEKTP